MASFEENVINSYINEYIGLDNAIRVLEDRKTTIDDILRNEFDFVITKDQIERFWRLSGLESY